MKINLTTVLFAITLIFLLGCEEEDEERCGYQCLDLVYCESSYDLMRYPEETYFDLVKFRYKHNYKHDDQNPDVNKTTRISEMEYDKKFFKLIPYDDKDFPDIDSLSPEIMYGGRNRNRQVESPELAHHYGFPDDIDLIWVRLKYLAKPLPNGPRSYGGLSRGARIIDKDKNYIISVSMFTNPCLYGSGLFKYIETM